ncbi:TraR/DksA family transcriptional regulator [Vibrio parahaemolyticus]|uniref:TraR/DksA family transcriptional regulator n=1 Tax=Vibrio TaxID=662 RepID=UPI001A8C5A9F|nr:MULTISPECIES: TraR/DksA family transcriptional regulator [Vibrio]EGQ7973540.1 TraR/DksA family transcriptional regulator [Vibrio parahaemolyticus]MBO0208558.1 TraR/DksA family transcriptional regulator [Vibrio sp. Vb0877]MCR9809149.1 hypothetical protein [Vibrio parahaemolyticus]MDW2323141.1 TraR/DksA family transcriptional regulator [Vibrio sp. 1159]
MQEHEFLSKQQIRSIREKVTHGIADIEKRLESEESQTLTIGMNMPDITDRATLETSRNNEQAIRFRQEKQLLNLRKVLGRLTHNLKEFGFCDTCGIEIEYDRLIGILTAHNCLDCQRVEDHKAGHVH